MDPFSIIVGSTGLLDILWRCGSYLKDLLESATKIEEDILGLSHEIDALISVYESITETSRAEHRGVPGTSLADSNRVDNLWRNVETLLKDCRVTVGELEGLLAEIIGKGGSSKVTGRIDGLKKTLRREKKDGEFKEIRLKLMTYQNSLQVLLTALNL